MLVIFGFSDVLGPLWWHVTRPERRQLARKASPVIGSKRPACHAWPAGDPWVEAGCGRGAEGNFNGSGCIECLEARTWWTKWLCRLCVFVFPKVTCFTSVAAYRMKQQAKHQLSTLPRPGFAIAFAQGRRRLNLPGESPTKPSVVIEALSDLSTLVSRTSHIHNYTRSLGLSEDNLPLLLVKLQKCQCRRTYISKCQIQTWENTSPFCIRMKQSISVMGCQHIAVIWDNKGINSYHNFLFDKQIALQTVRQIPLVPGPSMLRTVSKNKHSLCIEQCAPEVKGFTEEGWYHQHTNP